MTPAGLDTWRRALGLSVEEMATVCGVQDRTARRWAAGDSAIPDDVVQSLEDLEERMDNAVDQLVELVRATAKAGPVILWRYRTQADLDRSPHAAGLPLGAHAMMIAWASDALGAEDIDVEIHWANLAQQVSPPMAPATATDRGNLTYDDKTGWVTSSGEPRWRATKAAVDRVAGKNIEWLKDDKPGRRVHVAHLPDGTPVAVLRFYPAHKRWSAKIEGFAAWRFDRILQTEDFREVAGFDQLKEAQRFVRAVLVQAGARFVDSTR